MLTEPDVAALRDATPGCSQRIHLNNAGAALPTRRTLDTVVDHLRREAMIGGYEAAAERAADLTAVRTSLARLLGARPDEVALTTSDTSAWTKAFWGFVLAGGLEPSRRIITDHTVYNSHHFAVLQAVRYLGATVEVVPAGADGTLDLARLAAALDTPAAMVSLTHVPTSSGLVNLAAEVGAMSRSAGVPFFLDACQSVGQLSVDVRAIGCAVATGTGRKWLRGPRGTGLLFVAADFAERLDPPGIDATSASWTEKDDYELAPAARRADEFEGPIAAQLGLGAAVDQLLELGIDSVTQRIGELADHLRTRLDEVPGLQTADGHGPRSGIVTFTVEGRSAEEVQAAAAVAGINLSVSRSEDARLDLGVRGLDAVVRASPHVYNTVDELERLVELVAGGWRTR
jgi:selenocysteine lyase/cysteine desulfurase